MSFKDEDYTEIGRAVMRRASNGIIIVELSLTTIEMTECTPQGMRWERVEKPHLHLMFGAAGELLPPEPQALGRKVCSIAKIEARVWMAVGRWLFHFARPK